MIIDCHVHLSDERLQTFLWSFASGGSNRLHVISNSVDIRSSKLNLELSFKYDSINAFVGIHPEILLNRGESLTTQWIDEMCDQLVSLCPNSSGIGEIGLDPKYGNIAFQRHLLKRQLNIAEKDHSLSISLHSRDSISEILSILTTYDLKNSVLFHWFSGSNEELRILNSRGYYASFGLPALYSKRIANLVKTADKELLLAETDSPAIFTSISDEPITPFHVASVIFAMASIRAVSFDEMQGTNEFNARRYLKRKTH